MGKFSLPFSCLPLVIVYHFSDDDSACQICINAAIESPWNWVVIWHEHQPELAININSILLVAVANELMPSLGWCDRDLG